MGDVEIGGRFGRLYALADWPVRLAAINLLWIVGVLAGLVVFGVAPSTAAAFDLTREICLGRRPALWADFWRSWRRNLVRSQLVLGVPFATVWVLVFYTLAVREIRPLLIALAVVTALYSMTLLYVPAAFAHFDLPAIRLWQATVVYAWRQPLLTIGLALGIAGIVVFMLWFVPTALVFFAVSVPALAIVRVALRVFGDSSSAPDSHRL